MLLLKPEGGRLMDNFDLSNFKEDGEDAIPTPDPEKEKPIPFDDSDVPAKPVSRKPLSMGAGTPVKTPAPAATPAAPPPPVRPAAKPGEGPVARSAAVASTPIGRISGLKTFFTKLHPGALDFLDEQVGIWLNAHPEVHIKKTNVAVGDVMSKKTEPNIILNVWY
jgi:hypothetical protein